MTPMVDETNRTSCGDDPVRDLYVTDPKTYRQAQRLLYQMTIDHKVLALTGLGPPSYEDFTRWEDIQQSRDIPDLNVAGYQWRDGPHGLNLEAGVGRDPLQNYSTSFPTSVVQGATFDLDLVYKVGEAMGDETVAAHNSVLLAPCMNLLRNPLWGRAQETFGEDSFHLGRIATALTLGLQTYITGCAKHYMANNIEIDRFSINAQMDEQTMREIYGRHFEMVIRDGGVGCIMASYNSVNGKKSTQNRHTLTQVLRYDFGFRGFVLTDWWAMPGRNNGQGPVDPPNDAFQAAEALQAGLDVEVPWGINFDAIPTIVGDGTVPRDVVDTAVLRVLEQKLRFKSAFLNTQKLYGLKAPKSQYDEDLGSLVGPQLAAHADLAREAAEKGMVLLKNEDIGGRKALPITGVQTVAVIGATVDFYVRSDTPQNKPFDFVRDAALGDRGSSRVRPNPGLTVGPLAGIEAAAAAQGITVVAGSTAAEAAAADFVIVVVGTTPEDEGEEYTGAGDRRNLDLVTNHKEGPNSGKVTDVHNPLVASVAALGKPMVVVVEAGGAVNMPWRNDVDAIVMAWYPGQQGGTALGRLLFGQANFAGRLPITWPESLNQFPVFNEGNTTRMDYYTGYRYFDHHDLTPLYHFGYGLSYSTFAYERLHIPCADVTTDGLIQIDVDVRNTAGPAGDEVIQVYVSYPNTTARRSEKELKGFARVRLEPGQGKRVSIPLRLRDLRYWDMKKKDWVVEQGPVLVQVGPSSNNLPLQQTFTVN
jgi:beta-glucosidase